MHLFNHFMQSAIDKAKQAPMLGEVPVGAVLAHKEKIISVAHNLVMTNTDPTAHAEMLVLAEAAKIMGTRYLSGCTLYVTLEPCAMCAGAISHTKLGKLVFGAYDIKSGAVENGPRIFDASTTHHKPEIFGGIMEDECQKLMTHFFQNIRQS